MLRRPAYGFAIRQDTHAMALRAIRFAQSRYAMLRMTYAAFLVGTAQNEFFPFRQ